MLVALLLSVLSFGVGYYLVEVYDVNLGWKRADTGAWYVNSVSFFKEIYPLAAGVILVSLFSYFLIASAVRRYKFYLDSGQDYRKMVSLATSIDDLTNPTQIARLSDYPELQGVLRNYGDQIRQISRELDDKEKDSRIVDLEIEVDSLIDGRPLREELVEGKWWEPIIKKLNEFIGDNRRRVKELEEHSELVRRIMSRGVLSCGKVQESTDQTCSEISEIVRAAEELLDIMNGAGMSAAGGEKTGAVGYSGAAIDEMEKVLRQFEQDGQSLYEFAEQNNGVALSIALMAARGEVSGRDLAKSAEKVRSTAEQFNKMGRTITNYARTLLVNCTKLKETSGSPSAIGGGRESHVDQSISGIVSDIQQRGESIHATVSQMDGELRDVNELLERGLSKQSATDSDAEVISESGPGTRNVNPEEREIVNYGAGEGGGIDSNSDLVIDHGKVWEEPKFSTGIDDFSKTEAEEIHAGSEPGGDERYVLEDPASVELPEGGLQQDAVTDAEKAVDESISASGREQDPQAGMPGHDGGWMEMPGQRWLKVDVEKDGILTSEVEEDVSVREEGIEMPPKGIDARPIAAGGATKRDGEGVSDPGSIEISDNSDGFAGTEEAVGCEAEDEGPIYDLFELGAVEYSEESQVS